MVMKSITLHNPTQFVRTGVLDQMLVGHRWLVWVFMEHWAWKLTRASQSGAVIPGAISVLARISKKNNILISKRGKWRS